MDYRIRYGGAIIGQEEKDAIMKVVNRNWWQLDKEGELMEKEAAEFLGVKYGVLANSGSSAGLMALAALELPKGSEVVIPAVTFPTIFNTIIQCGLVPVVVDAKIGTYNLDVADVEKVLSRKTKAVWAIHALGNPVDMPALMKLAERKDLYILEDNCDGWGTEINGKKIGSFGDVSITSFHAAHIVAMGEGGGVFTNHAWIARNARMYRDWGRQADQGAEWKYGLPEDYNPRFIYEKIGYNLKPLELQAAMGRVQLRKADEIKRLRKANFDYLVENLNKYPSLIMPRVVEGADVCWFALPLTYIGDRGKLVAHLEENGIETRSMFAGNILKHPAYRKVKHRKGNLDQANYILEHSFWVGVHPRMTQGDREYAIKVFNDFFNL